MSHLFRFFGKKLDNDEWLIEGSEFSHLKKVLRLHIGDPVEVMDGQGSWVSGSIADFNGKQALIRVFESFFQPRSASRLVLCVGALKPSTMDEVIPSLVELGMDKLYVIGQEGIPKSRYSEKALIRWQRIVESATKQCKRSWLATVEVMKGLESLNDLTDLPKPKLVLSETSQRRINGVDIENGCTAVIGSELGLRQRELEGLRKQGFVEVKFCDTILRSKTAILGLAAYITAIR